jgi:tetrahydromethanopterin S-methyltransferase subunit G
VDGLKERLDKLEQAMDHRFEKLEQAVDHRFEKAEQEARRRHDETMFAVRTLIDYNNLNQRLSQLERKALSGPSDQ